MLVLERERGESILVIQMPGQTTRFRIQVSKIAGTKVFLGIDAPRDWCILREELGTPDVAAHERRVNKLLTDAPDRGTRLAGGASQAPGTQ